MGSAVQFRLAPLFLFDLLIGLMMERKQIYTPEFKRWFGDSKVVDTNGQPLVVYHGTNAEFDTFDVNKFGHWDNGTKWDFIEKKPLKDKGFFFTADKNTAQDHAEGAVEWEGGKPIVLDVYLRIEKPLLVQVDEFKAKHKGYDTQYWYDYLTFKLLHEYEAGDYDGIIVTNPIDNNDKLFVVFKPNQIKSASRNNGQFNPESDNILQGIDYSDAKFKVGDTVKCTAMGRPSYGEVFTIKKVHKIKGKYEYDGSNGVYNYEEYSLELIQRNKSYDPAECLRVLNYICIDCFKKPISFVTVGYDGIFLSYCLGGKFGEIEERLNQYLWGKDILKSFISSREKNKQGITYSIKNDEAILDYVKEQIDYPSLERKPEMFKVGNVYYDDKWVYQVVKAYRDEKTAADECRIAKINDKGSWDDSTYSVQTAAQIFKDCTFYGNESTQILPLELEDKKAFYKKVRPFKIRVQAILDKYHSKAEICRTYVKGSHIKGGIVRPCDEVWIQSSPYDRFPLVEDNYDSDKDLEIDLMSMIIDLQTDGDRDRRLRLAKAKAKALKMKLELMKI